MDLQKFISLMELAVGCASAAPADAASVPEMVLRRWFCILTCVNFPVEILMLEIAALIRPYFAGSWNWLWMKCLMP
jgi:hypothetical protein